MSGFGRHLRKGNVLSRVDYAVQDRSDRANAHPSLQDLSAQDDGALILGFLPDPYVSEHVQKWHEQIGVFKRWKPGQQKWNKKPTTLGWKVD